MINTQQNETSSIKNLESKHDMLIDYQDLLTITDLQSILGVGRTTAYRLINDGTIKHIRIGKIIRIPKICMLDYMLFSCYPENG